MPRFLAAVECALEHDGKYLFILRPAGVHAAGLLAFPGGKVEYTDGHENTNILLDAVKREVFEEVGLRLMDPIHYVTSRYFVDSSQENVLDTIFYCKLEQTALDVNPSSKEVAEYYWLTPQELLQHPKAPIWLQKDIADIESIKQFTF
jgi:8-oxo-dGTP diphosphatase